MYKKKKQTNLANFTNHKSEITSSEPDRYQCFINYGILSTKHRFFEGLFIVKNFIFKIPQNLKINRFCGYIFYSISSPIILFERIIGFR